MPSIHQRWTARLAGVVVVLHILLASRDEQIEHAMNSLLHCLLLTRAQALLLLLLFAVLLIDSFALVFHVSGARGRSRAEFVLLLTLFSLSGSQVMQHIAQRVEIATSAIQ